MKREKSLVKTDSRNRITIPKQLNSGLNQIYQIYEKDGNIILEPIREIPEREKWLFDPKNRAIVEELKEALLESPTIDLGDFKKYLKKKI
jgi:hypothetical protein